jgi:hypothetical protein
MNMALSNIAAALDALDDSHTFFLPPHGGRNGKNSGNQTRYGSDRREWRWGYLESDP